jgi:hypothetical protein
MQVWSFEVDRVPIEVLLPRRPVGKDLLEMIVNYPFFRPMVRYPTSVML